MIWGPSLIDQNNISFRYQLPFSNYALLLSVASREHCSRVPIKITAWYLPMAAPQVYGQCLSRSEIIEVTIIVQCIYRESRDDSVLLERYRPQVGRADWAFGPMSGPSPPPRWLTTRDVMQATAPTMCCVVLAAMWVLLTNDTLMALTIFSFMLSANVGALMLVGIISICEN